MMEFSVSNTGFKDLYVGIVPEKEEPKVSSINPCSLIIDCKKGVMKYREEKGSEKIVTHNEFRLSSPQKVLTIV